MQGIATNEKLTALMKGRKISGIESGGGTSIIFFNDGSTMSVRIHGVGNAGCAGGTIAKVSQAESELVLDLKGGWAIKLHTAEPTACVTVKDRNGALEYVD
jgi:hypothetical protein